MLILAFGREKVRRGRGGGDLGELPRTSFSCMLAK